MNRRPVAIDIFSGAGGLSLGLQEAGFRVAAAVEISPNICKTYAANHPGVALITEDARRVTGKMLLEAAGVKHIDLVAGCPPCQGFTSLTHKYRGGDPRNTLLLEMARIVGELRPTAVLMENVSGLADRGKHLLDAFTARLVGYGYSPNCAVLQLADYCIPQTRRRLVLTAGKGFTIPLPMPSHSRTGATDPPTERWLTVRDAIARMTRPVTLREAMKDGGPEAFGWHVVRDLQPATRDRLLAVRPGQSRTALPDDLRPECHRGRSLGFTNVYGRMSWDSPAPAITGGCTSFCKGRFGHPTENRTISVREAALIQGFPNSYRLVTPHMDRACDMVGNALPPPFAKSLGMAALAVLGPRAR